MNTLKNLLLETTYIDINFLLRTPDELIERHLLYFLLRTLNKFVERHR